MTQARIGTSCTVIFKQIFYYYFYWPNISLNCKNRFTFFIRLNNLYVTIMTCHLISIFEICNWNRESIYFEWDEVFPLSVLQFCAYKIDLKQSALLGLYCERWWTRGGADHKFEAHSARLAASLIGCWRYLQIVSLRVPSPCVPHPRSPRGKY